MSSPNATLTAACRCPWPTGPAAEILSVGVFSGQWNGGAHQDCITLTPDQPHPDFHDFAKSHFSRGVVTFHPGYLFRTPPGWSMWAGGPPNHVKDGIPAAHDWLPFPFTMIHPVRAGCASSAVSRSASSPCLADKALAQVQPVTRSLASNDDLRAQYDAWFRQREEFNRRLMKQDPDAVRDAWQRYYFKGEMPEQTGAAPANHVNKRRLKAPRLGV